MDILNRASLSIKRTFGKTILLFLLIILTGTFLSLGSSIRQAIIRTELNLRERLPPVAAIEWEHRALGIENEFEFLTMDMIEAVAALPYIRDYDLRSTTALFLQDLSSTIPELELRDELLQFYNEYLTYGRQGHVPVVGINNPHPFDLQAELINLPQGRFMTDDELVEGREVAVISTTFAQENNLSLGDYFSLEYHVQDIVAFWERMEFEMSEYGYMRYPSFKENEILYRYESDFEIIGLFEVNHDIIDIKDLGMLMDVINLYNQVYVPHNFLEGLHIDSFSYILQNIEGFESIGQEIPFSPTEERPMHLKAAFLLYDPRDFNALSTAAEEVLPPDWFIIDLSTAFAPFMASMDNMLWIGGLIFWVSALATAIILSLTVILFLRDRRYEIGIYLALGEKKKSIFIQLLVEVFVITAAGLIISLFFGNLLANQFSHNLLEQEIIQQMEANDSDFHHWDLQFFLPESLSFEEMMEAYRIDLTITQVGVFLITGVVTILISASIPILHTLKLNPKDVLTFNQES